jgi:hypothetical protein
MSRASIPTLILSVAAAFAVAGAAARAATPPPASVSGCINQTITNGMWSLTVTKAILGVEPGYDIAAWGITFTLENPQKKSATPGDTGVGEPQVVLKDGTKLDMWTDSEIDYGRAITYTEFKPGSKVSGTYWFRTSGAATAVVFVLPVSATNEIYSSSLGYAMKNPTLSVDLTCNKSASPSP